MVTITNNASGTVRRGDSGRSSIERSLDATVEYASLIGERVAADTRSVKIPPCGTIDWFAAVGPASHSRTPHCGGDSIWLTVERRGSTTCLAAPSERPAHPAWSVGVSPFGLCQRCIVDTVSDHCDSFPIVL
ncbi:hypothetical protein C8039_06105 [Halogeometricum sp. wsp3]|nr:hypothetical protein C8039_06105 [Halogeometricum sp. wsp3]